MSKSTMSDIARIIGQVARLDLHGKRVVLEYLNEEVEKAQEAKVVTYKEGEE